MRKYGKSKWALEYRRQWRKIYAIGRGILQNEYVEDIKIIK